MIKRRNLSWKVKMSYFQYHEGNEVISIPYYCPYDLVEYLVSHEAGALLGGFENPGDVALHLESYWKAFSLHHGDHQVFVEHQDSLSRVVPIVWHGDEGRGKRRGNTCVVSIESVFSAYSSQKDRPTAGKRSRADMECPCQCNSNCSC